MDTKNDSTPKRRFPGFEGEWKEKKLGEISNITAGGDVDKDKLLTEGNYPVLANAHTNEGIIGYYEEDYQIEAPAVTVTGRGDIGFAKARKENFTPVVRLLSIKSKHNVDFLAEAINQNKVIFESTGVPQLTIPKLSNYKIHFPSEVEEENSIGNFLVSLDSLISLQQQKLDKLKNLKKAYLSEMFPAEGECVPKRRFPGFEGEWEQKKLGEVSTVTMGQSPNSENYTDNPNDYILVQGNADMKNGRVFPRVWTTQITKQAKQGDLILSVRAPVGDIGKTDYDVVLGRGVASIDGNEFLYQALSQMKQKGYWSKLSTGSTFESINSNDIKSAIISLPSLPEQEAIGSFFLQLDKSISLQQQKLDKLNDLKKAYLNELFV